MSTPTMKQYRILPFNAKVPSSGFALVGAAHDYPNYMNGTRVETAKILGVTKDRRQAITESLRVWNLAEPDGTMTPEERRQMDDFIGKAPVLEFDVDEDTGFGTIRPKSPTAAKVAKGATGRTMPQKNRAGDEQATADATAVESEPTLQVKAGDGPSSGS